MPQACDRKQKSSKQYLPPGAEGQWRRSSRLAFATLYLYRPNTKRLLDDVLGVFAVARQSGAIAMLDYMVASGEDYERYVNHPGDYPEEAEAYNEFFAQNELVKEFVPDRRRWAARRSG